MLNDKKKNCLCQGMNYMYVHLRVHENSRKETNLRWLQRNIWRGGRYFYSERMVRSSISRTKGLKHNMVTIAWLRFQCYAFKSQVSKGLKGCETGGVFPCNENVCSRYLHRTTRARPGMFSLQISGLVN